MKQRTHTFSVLVFSYIYLLARHYVMCLAISVLITFSLSRQYSWTSLSTSYGGDVQIDSTMTISVFLTVCLKQSSIRYVQKALFRICNDGFSARKNYAILLAALLPVIDSALAYFQH